MDTQKFLQQMQLDQPLFSALVADVVTDVWSFLQDSPWGESSILAQLIVPDRILRFKVLWEDDSGHVQVNQGWRVQHSHLLGPYKGGLRFTKHVNEDTLCALAFEQSLKCSLTGMSMGGAKGGADFDSHGRSEREVKRFCAAFMEKLYPFIGADEDVPAGDMGVGKREIGYMFGKYVSLTNQFSGVLTGKHANFGGSCGREEATGYGVMYFANDLCKAHERDIAKQSSAISGAGHVALFAAQKALQLGAKVLSLSDTSGTCHFGDGLNQEQLDAIKQHKLVARKSLQAWSEEQNDKNITLKKDAKPWQIKADIYVPAAVQNEIEVDDVKAIINNDGFAVIEGSNLSLTEEAIDAIEKSSTLYVQGKAANAGGVAVSNFERSQNASYTSWSLSRVENQLQLLMQEIHEHCWRHAPEKNGRRSYKQGANIYAFSRLAQAANNHGLI